MPYDDRLAARIRATLDGEKDVREIQMFGGLCFTMGGHMCCGLGSTDLMVRVGPDAYTSAYGNPMPDRWTSRADP